MSAVGLSPHEASVKLLFVVLGAAWIATAVGVALYTPWAWITGIAVAIATLWYLIPGTIISAAILIILLATPLRVSLDRS